MPCMMPDCASILFLNDYLHCFINLKTTPTLFAWCVSVCFLNSMCNTVFQCVTQCFSVFLLTQEMPCKMLDCISSIFLNENLHCFICLKTTPAFFACCSFWNNNTSPSVFLQRSVIDIWWLQIGIFGGESDIWWLGYLVVRHRYLVVGIFGSCHGYLAIVKDIWWLGYF